MKKETYYSVKCPECEFKSIGNWREKQINEYTLHYCLKHMPKPIIKSEKR